MPIFEFRCLICGNVFEKLFNTRQEEFVALCPECNAEYLERVISRTNYIMGSSQGGDKTKLTSKSCSTGNSCISFEIPGPE
ncbi:Zinc ribbon domain protein [Sporotomaculum syntrophicum]|uniref:Zinc ribbon domain protein n=1 Tax=Sporotomaculum syntrophicum TaxID=182264 RepID=A0A9D3AZK0_9FIRM|nr:zinc ribbon domain-containing protein [Sporotomaculum syntrophicum]KAF1085979.1 Zinc ribbon domain protein [Sporotomaculum syntrophicum]